VFADAEYRTRILVVRPRDPEQFNGTVVVNWQNVSAGVESGTPTDEIFHGAAAGWRSERVGHRSSCRRRPAMKLRGEDVRLAFDPP
jgi:hypothetical protein